MGNNAIVTGGAGFIGSHLIESIIDKFDKIYVIDNLIRTNGSLRNIENLRLNPKVKFLRGDVTNFDFDTINDGISHLFHLAATRINRCAQFNREGHDFIASGGFNVVDFCAKNKIKMFFSSTASVYQKPKILPIKEDVACVPHTIYGAAKLYTENLIRSYDNMYGMDYTINRFFSVYGVRMDNAGAYTEVIFNWLNSIKNGNNTLTVQGNPDEKVLDLVYVSDVVNAILLTTFNSNKDVFNVSTMEGVTLTELIDCIETITNAELKVNITPEIRTDVELKRVGDISKLKDLGWERKVTLEDGIRKVWNWINE
ncbi:MAG TPA: GDP-mannose 4,6-dehydratase [Candidatus Methylomirabilis sp.]|nr:GDP-mannose 4,6-dehydratase [Candidatus Methylomirabilis sp.]